MNNSPCIVFWNISLALLITSSHATRCGYGDLIDFAIFPKHFKNKRIVRLISILHVNINSATMKTFCRSKRRSKGLVTLLYLWKSLFSKGLPLTSSSSENWSVGPIRYNRSFWVATLVILCFNLSTMCFFTKLTLVAWLLSFSPTSARPTMLKDIRLNCSGFCIFDSLSANENVQRT